MKITTDLVVVGGLSIALIVGVVMGAPAELLTGIAGGLSGYLSKTAVNHFENSHEIAREKDEVK
ncbi:hypothetical protein SAMN05216582_12715 [Selenomonas ruminantium]|uniref:Uncharacterized protein n=1 Tax=Selenomonas ruminantium TaxID=971 RepID=A0A1M6WPR4_SELRU|nr:hypothetical protein [Selenomonas ruminantium]SHK95688.1 hypothetical protein SAMN05216582_12715 [Selenomonas ruminantium]